MNKVDKQQKKEDRQVEDTLIEEKQFYHLFALFNIKGYVYYVFSVFLFSSVLNQKNAVATGKI